MKRLAVLIFMAATISSAADVRFTWLPSSSNVLGAPQTQTPVTQYGINVLMDSDNPKVTEFQVTLVYKLASGEIRTVGGTTSRSGKVPNVQYSTIYPVWVGLDMNFEVLSLQVKALSAKDVTRPIPGMSYSSEDSNN